MKPIQSLKTAQFWLLAIAVGLITIHLTLLWKLTTDLNLLSINLLGCASVVFILGENRHQFNFKSDIFSSFLGFLLVAFVLLRNFLMTTLDAFFMLSPLLAAIGLALLASGIKGLRQYLLALLVIFAITAPIGLLIQQLFDISILTAKTSTIFLHYLGFEVIRQGVYVILPTGAVEVYPGCSGLESIIQLLRLSVLFLVMFPTLLIQKIIVPLIAILIAFIVNAVRVGLMAILIAYSSKDAFEYWHTGTGSEIFFLISALIFGLFCYLISKNHQQNSLENNRRTVV